MSDKSQWPTDPLAQRIEALRRHLVSFRDASPSNMWSGYYHSEWPKAEDEILKTIQEVCKQAQVCPVPP